MRKKTCLVLLSLLLANGICKAQSPAYTLGQGLLIFNEQNTTFFTKPIFLYKDSLLKKMLVKLELSQTTCPTCMLCAEPEESYPGKIHPLFCGSGNGMQFICTGNTKHYSEIIIDTFGAKAYVKKGMGSFYNWNSYMQMKARQGEYFMFVRQWDSTVLYDKQYDLNNLPAADKDLLVGLAIENVSGIEFYPVLVQGYWMKLRYRDKKGRSCYCWFIWRNEKEWLNGFKFHA